MLNLKNMFNTFQDIYEPSRGGVRGGHDQFSWDEVKTDKDRENYLGHSIKAPVGRSQGGPDFLWYTKNREKKTVEKLSISDEKKKVIEMEQLAMSRALGPAYSLLTKNAATPSHPFIMTPAEKKKPKVEPKKSNVKGREKNSKPVEKHAKKRVTPDRKCKNLQNKSEKKIRKSSPKKREVEIEPKYKVHRERDRSTKIPKRKSPIKDKESRSERHRKKY